MDVRYRIMKNRITIIALLLLTLLPGCQKPEKEQRVALLKGREGKPEAAKQPYYYGLVEEYRNILAEDPHNRAATIALANAFYDSGNWKEAIIYYERSLRLEPHDSDIRTDLGTCYRNIGMPDRAIVEYQKALEQTPGHVNARYNLGVVYAYDKKDYASAVREWEELLRIAPGFHHADVIRHTIKSFKKKIAGKGQQ